MGKDQKNNITQDEEFLLTNKKSSTQRKTTKGAAKKREFPVFTVFCVVVGVLLTAFIVQSILKNNGFYDRKKVVMTVGDTTINAVEFSYFYNQTAKQQHPRTLCRKGSRAPPRQRRRLLCCRGRVPHFQ